jgi:hypothetical protein
MAEDLVALLSLDNPAVAFELLCTIIVSNWHFENVDHT